MGVHGQKHSMGDYYVYHTLHVIHLLGETLMTYAYTSILCALLLYVGVVSIDRYFLIETVPASEVRIKYGR